MAKIPYSLRPREARRRYERGYGLPPQSADSMA